MTDRSSSFWNHLVQKCRTGDEKAWQELIKLIYPLIFSICSRMRMTREESFDVFGQVCYLLLKNLDRIKSSDKLLSYVSTMTRREIYSLKKRGQLIEETIEEGYGLSPAKQIQAPDILLELTERNEGLMKALTRLPQRDFELIRLLFLDRAQPNYEEISRRLDMPVSSIGPTRARSLGRLLRILKREKFTKNLES